VSAVVTQSGAIPDFLTISQFYRTKWNVICVYKISPDINGMFARDSTATLDNSRGAAVAVGERVRVVANVRLLESVMRGTPKVQMVTDLIYAEVNQIVRMKGSLGRNLASLKSLRRRFSHQSLSPGENHSAGEIIVSGL
jgi:hypothetical protein